jgi:hypothetical protein
MVGSASRGAVVCRLPHQARPVTRFAQVPRSRVASVNQVSAYVSAIVHPADHQAPVDGDFRHFVARLAKFAAIPPLLLVALVVAVDPYYVFGSPNLPGFNVVRPLYESHVPVAKPYQVRRIDPGAVILGSSRAEVGLDPHHPGWAGRSAFNFGLPSASSYEVMLAFLHAQAGGSLKQAVVGLDFFAYNIFFPRNREYIEARFSGDGVDAFAEFLSSELTHRRQHREPAARPQIEPVEAPPEPSPPAEPEEDIASGAEWNEALYLRIYPDVATEVSKGTFTSGYQHYFAAGRAEGRRTGKPPPGWNEALYLRLHPDVAAEVQKGTFVSGYHHYLVAGRREGRATGTSPPDWNEALYLRIYPDVAAEVRKGTFISGYHHYLAAGRAEGRATGTPPPDWNEALYLRLYPDVAAEVQKGTFLSGYHHYLVAGRAEGRATGTPPPDWNEALYLRIYPDVAAEVQKGTFVSGYHHYLVAGRAEGRATGTPPPDWNEALYLRLYPDVAAEVQKGAFLSGYHHYLVAGRAEGRATGTPPPDWNEALYLRLYPDVAAEVQKGTFLSGYHHYLAAGKSEHREGGLIPSEWNDFRYQQVNQDVGYRVARGQLLNGYQHYLTAGRTEGRQGGFLPEGWNDARYLENNPAARIRLALGDYSDGYGHYAAGQGEGPAKNIWDRLRQQSPGLRKAVFQISELFRLVLSRTGVSDALATLRRQSDAASFNDRGMRVWDGQDDVLRAIGGTGRIFRSSLPGSQWYLWLMPPRYMYCFSNSDTAMSSFDAFRFMLRRGYQQRTDLRLFITPLHVSVRYLLTALGLGERYEFWQRELVRISEEEAARAGRKPFPLWDFSDANSITRETIPAATDLTPMRWYWEISHYRNATGSLILNRVLGYTDAERPLPADFGVRLTADTIDAHLAHSKAGLADWAMNSEFAMQISKATHGPKVQNRQAEATCW